MYVVNGSDGRCIVTVRLIVGVRYLERPLMEVLLCSKIWHFLYIYTFQNAGNLIFFPVADNLPTADKVSGTD